MMPTMSMATGAVTSPTSESVVSSTAGRRRPSRAIGMETAQASMAGLSIDCQGIPAPSVGLRCLVFLRQWQKRSAFRGARLNQFMAVQRFGSEFKEQVVRGVVEKDRTVVEVAGSYGLVPWGGGGWVRRWRKGSAGVRGLRGRCGAVGGGQEAARLVAGGQGLGGGLPGEAASFLRAEGPGGRPGAYLGPSR